MFLVFYLCWHICKESYMKRKTMILPFNVNVYNPGTTFSLDVRICKHWKYTFWLTVNNLRTLAKIGLHLCVYGCEWCDEFFYIWIKCYGTHMITKKPFTKPQSKQIKVEFIHIIFSLYAVFFCHLYFHFIFPFAWKISNIIINGELCCFFFLVAFLMFSFILLSFLHRFCRKIIFLYE